MRYETENFELQIPDEFFNYEDFCDRVGIYKLTKVEWNNIIENFWRDDFTDDIEKLFIKYIRRISRDYIDTDLYKSSGVKKVGRVEEIDEQLNIEFYK